MKKQTKKLDVIMGVSGSGKTSFAKWHAKKNNGVYLDFDTLFDYKRNSYDKFFRKLSNIMNTQKNNLFVLDGYVLDNCPPPSLIKEKTGCEVQFYLCFAAPHIIIERQKKKVRTGSYDSVISRELAERITSWCFRVITSLSKNPIFIDTTKGTFEIMKKDKFILRWQELIFLSALNDMNHDKFYQDIEFPSGMIIRGYSESGKTWERVSSIVDFSGTSVLDIGSFHGFFSFKAEEKGASKVVGIEKNKNAFKMARRIALFKNSKVLFILKDIVEYKPNYIYDIVLVLNILHHIPDIEKALGNIFKSGKTIIFEIPVEQEKIILKYASNYNFKLTSQMNSHRECREIIILESPESKIELRSNVLDEYRFSYRRYQIQKLIKYIKSLKLFYPLRLFVRYIKRQTKEQIK